MKKAFLITTGTCYPHNTDSQLIEAYLRNNGWTLSKKIKEANLIIINTCAFIKKNENRAFEFIKKAQKEKRSDAEIIVTGCLPAINKVKLQAVFNGITIGANSLQEFNKLLNEKLRIQDVKYIGSTRFLRKNEYKHAEYFLRIGWGCHGKCSYCAVRFVFGKPRSRPIPDILQEFNIAYDKGYRRFVLIANDSGSYGEDLDTSIIDLLYKLCQKKRNCQFALSHLTPDKLKEILPSLKKFIRLGRIWRINIPVESGSNRIIQLMNRSYTVNDFKYCIEKLIGYNPNLEIKTDIIVGFPSETEQDFLDSLRLVEWLGRNNVWFQSLIYSPRPNTEASKLPGQIDQRTKAIRIKRLKDLCSFSRILREKKLFKKLKRKIVA